jgi:hypothetical protein
MSTALAIRDRPRFKKRVNAALLGVPVPHKRFLPLAITNLEALAADVDLGYIGKLVGKVMLFILIYVLPIILEMLVIA